jgi:hypothetical protein
MSLLSGAVEIGEGIGGVGRLYEGAEFLDSDGFEALLEVGFGGDGLPGNLFHGWSCRMAMADSPFPALTSLASSTMPEPWPKQ